MKKPTPLTHKPSIRTSSIQRQAIYPLRSRNNLIVNSRFRMKDSEHLVDHNILGVDSRGRRLSAGLVRVHGVAVRAVSPA